jgi:hypothetical protein
MTFSPSRCIDNPPSDDAVVLCGDKSHTRMFLLRVEDVERGSLPDPRLLAHTVERNLGGVYLRGGCFDLRLGGVQLTLAVPSRRRRAAPRVER